MKPYSLPLLSTILALGLAVPGALAADPDNDAIKLELGQALSAKGEYEPALDLLLAVVKSGGDLREKEYLTVRLADTPVWAAAKEMDPGFNETYASLNVFFLLHQYRTVLLMASGLQMAGPRLTPATLERGLHRARFPNPSHRIMAGAVGFGDRDHSMTDDVAEMWWSNDAESPYDDGRGAWCYFGGGVRHAKGSWPEGEDALFDPPCDSGSGGPS